MAPPSRRQTLQALGLAVASTAGCLGASVPPTDQTTSATDDPATGPTLAPGETYETDAGRTVTVSDLAVHQSVVSVESVSGAHWYERVADAGDGQYLSFVVAVDGFDLETEDTDLYAAPIALPLAVELDGDRYADPIPVGRDADRLLVRVGLAHWRLWWSGSYIAPGSRYPVGRSVPVSVPEPVTATAVSRRPPPHSRTTSRASTPA